MKSFLSRYWTQLLGIIFLILGLFYYKKAYAYEHPVAVYHMQLTGHKALVYENCLNNFQKREFHKENAERCLKEAHNTTWYLPNISSRKKVQYCFTNAGVLLSPGEPRSKIIIALITSLVQYGMDCCDEWHYLNEKLYWAQYHAEMYEHYTDLIAHGYF